MTTGSSALSPSLLDLSSTSMPNETCGTRDSSCESKRSSKDFPKSPIQTAAAHALAGRKYS